jgi:pilus assembly protein FimV
VEEEAATARQEAENLRERMDALEAKLKEMSRLLKLKDEELAQLQAQATGADNVATETETTYPEGAEIETGAADSETSGEIAAEAGVEEEKEAVDITDVVPAEEPVSADTTDTMSSGEPEPAQTADEELSSETTEVVPPVAPEVETIKPSDVEQPLPVDGPWMQWLADNWKLVAGGGGTVLLGLVGLAVSRRRKTMESQELPPSATAVSTESESILQDEVAVPQTADTTMRDTSFLSEYSTEELRALNEDTVEVDPVSEADVYIAYGRYSQAEEILREAMENGNESTAVRHKMLEVYYATQKKEEFRKLAEEMKAAGQDEEDPKAWEHIQTMGRDLDRNNPLFAAAVAAGAMESESALTNERESDLALDLSSLAEEVDSALNPDSQPVDGFSNLDLELPSLQIEPGLQEAGTSKGEEAQEKPDELELNETELHTELADINDLGDLGIESNMLDDTLADLAGDLEGVVEDSQALEESLDLEESTLSALENLTSDASAGEHTGEETPGQMTDDEDSRLGDEVETKLELAKAFLEIGDADGARSILHEVREDGTPSQQKVAAQLLAQLEG